MARPGKGFFRKKSDASTGEDIQRRDQDGVEGNRTGKSVQETLQTADLVRKRFSLLERGSVYPIVEESLRFYEIPFLPCKGSPRDTLDSTAKRAPS